MRVARCLCMLSKGFVKSRNGKRDGPLPIRMIDRYASWKPQKWPPRWNSFEAAGTPVVEIETDVLEAIC